MSWVHDVPEDDLYEHEGFAVAVLADGSEPETLQFPVPGRPGITTGNSAWWLYNGTKGAPRATAVRAGCACGWRSPESFPVDFADHDRTEGWEDAEGPFKAWQGQHIGALLGTAMPVELRQALATANRLVRDLSLERPLVALAAIGELEKLVGNWAPTAGAGARRDGATWDAIGNALGTTRQGAHNRFSRYASKG